MFYWKALQGSTAFTVPVLTPLLPLFKMPTPTALSG
jgi:hypothetical protein